MNKPTPSIPPTNANSVPPLTEKEMEAEFARLKAENWSRMKRRGGAIGVVLLFAAGVQWHREIGAWTVGRWYATTSGAPAINIRSALERMEDEDTVLVDVRGEDEFAVSHLRGAINIPLDQIEKGKTAASWSHNQLIITYCTIGSRSGRAAEFLQEHGVRAMSIVGGIVAAAQAEVPLFDDNGPTFAVHVEDGTYAWMLPKDHRAVLLSKSEK